MQDADGNRITTNMDIQDHENVDIKHDLSVFPWPVEDQSFDGVFGRYCLEHLSWHDLPKALKEIYRILKQGGCGVFFVPNTLEQCKKVAETGVSKDAIELLFGSQEFIPRHIGSHKTGFSEEYAKKLFQDAGFKFVKTLPHPVSTTDMVIEAYKIDEIFERSYFEDGTYGYKDYRDFATHHSTARIIMDAKPNSVLDIGAGRGYIARILENQGIKATAMDISKHCWHTRVTDDFILWDAMNVPWMRQIPNGGQQEIDDKAHDLAFSINFLEHIPYDKIDDVIRESIRVSKAGLHGIHFSESPFPEKDEDRDITHIILESEQWWQDKFKSTDPDYTVILKHPRLLEYEHPGQQPQPVSYAPRVTDDLVKLNIGSFIDMFYFNWINIDIIDLKAFSENQSYNFLQHDVTKGLPYEDDSVDAIFNSHIIEHLTRDEGRRFLAECHRVLKQNSIFRISTPDTQLLTKQYLDGKIMDYKYINVGVEKAKDDAEAYYNLLLAGHLTIYDEDSLKKLMESVGFKEIKRVSPFESRSKIIQTQTLTTHPDISVILEVTL